MERPETFAIKNTRFLTPEEERVLKTRTAELGKQSAIAGRMKISNNMGGLTDLAINAKTATFVPAEYLSSASTQLWEMGCDPEEIFIYYQRWFKFNLKSAQTDMEIDMVNEIQSSFVNLVGKFATEEKDPSKQKQIMARSINFLDNNSFDKEAKVEHLMYYGWYLFEHGMEKAGRILVQTTAKLAPATVAKLPDLVAILEQVREED